MSKNVIYNPYWILSPVILSNSLSITSKSNWTFTPHVKDILEENAAKDPTVNKVYQSYKKFKEEVSAYHKVSEDAFVEARND